MQRRDYSGPADLRAMQELVQRTWSADSRLHIGDVAWQRNALPGQESGWRTSLWEDDGKVLAWGWVELPGHLSVVVDPARPELAAEVIAWFREVATGPLACSVLETEAHVVSALESAGFKPDDEAPFFTHHRMLLTDVHVPPVPDGFTLRHVRLDEVEKRAAGHRAAWSDWGPSKVTTESFNAVMSAWPYRPELDWAVEAPNGDFIATALIWLDDHSGLAWWNRSAAPRRTGVEASPKQSTSPPSTPYAPPAASKLWSAPAATTPTPRPATSTNPSASTPGHRTVKYVA